MTSGYPLQSGPTYNVLDFGARGDDTADDAAAFVAAFTAAKAQIGGTVVLPRPKVAYRIATAIDVTPATGTQMTINMRGLGSDFAALRWDGGNSTSMFRFRGLKRSTIEGIHIRIPTGKTSVVAWDIDGDNTFGNCGQLKFSNCSVDLHSGATTCIGWRMGNDAQAGDISQNVFELCNVSGGALAALHRGWELSHQNTLIHEFRTCGGTTLDKMFSNISGSSTGGGEHYFYNCGGTSNTVDFDLAPGNYGWYGGRFEVGKRFLQTPAGQTNPFNLHLSAVAIDDYTPSDDKVIDMSAGGAASTALILDGCRIARNTAVGVAFSAAMISGHCGTGFASLNARGCKFRAADPFWTLQGTNPWKVNVEGCQLLDGNTAVSGTFRERRDWGAGVFDTEGTGTPEAAITAGIGSTYRRKDGGAGTSLYVKESGTGNTGWVGK